MRLITAIIQPTKLAAVREALAKVGVEHLTALDAQGYARQRGQTATYRGNEYQTNLLRKVELQIIVNDDFVDRTVETLTRVARSGPTGNFGDGKIMITPIADAVRIVDMVRGPEAVS